MALDDYEADRSTSGGGGRRGDFFKPAEYENAFALLVEQESFDAEATNPFHDPKDENSRATRAEATATISVFADQGDVADATPSEVIDGAVITNAKLARDLGRVNIGRQLLLKVTEKRFKGGNGRPGYKAWVWESVTDPKIRNAVDAYIESRDSDADEAPF